ncbi:uncharacterized protein TNCV_4628541 [Trichonephila clavipes]|nr:uncharacterized protein TNCV_4628541 [Trichonephila clavipes]
MQPNKRKRHFETLHGEYINKPREFFESNLKSYEKQKKNILKKTLSLNEKALRTSYKVSYKIARCKKPHAFAEERILPAVIVIVEPMFGDNFDKDLKSIPLSSDTVSRIIHDMAKDVEQNSVSRSSKNCVFEIDNHEEDVKRCISASENHMIFSLNEEAKVISQSAGIVEKVDIHFFEVGVFKAL